MNSYRMTMIGLLLVAVGCAKEPVGPDGIGGLKTDRVSYVAARHPDGLGYEFEIVARLVNDSGRTLYVEACDHGAPRPVFGIGMADPTFGGSAYTEAWACEGPPISVASGTTRVDTLRVWGPKLGQGSAVVQGRMRLYYGVRYCPNRCLEEAAGYGVSNDFDVRIPD